MNARPSLSTASFFESLPFFSILLFLILILGLIVRLLSWPTWPSLDAGSLLTLRPLPGNADGYFYLGLARDLVEGIYHNTDSLRVFPERPPRPNPIPMLSLMTASLARFTGLPLELIAGILPTVLGTLVALPAAIIGRELGGRLVGVAAAAFAVLMPYFVQRSSLGWYDTDTLNVIPPLCLAAVATVFLNKTLRARAVVFGFLIYSGSVVMLFHWWDQAPNVVVLLSVYPALLMVGFRWPSRPVRYASFGILLLIFAVMPISFSDIFSKSLGSIRYVNDQGGGVFSPTAIAIGEQQDLGFFQSASLVAGSWLMLVLAFVGLTYIGRKRPALILPLVPLIFIGGFGLFQAERFIIFLNPTVAIGLAGLLALARGQLSRTSAFVIMTSMSFAFVLVLFMARDYRAAAPIVPMDVVKHMMQIPMKLPADAVLWNLCDYGYALGYWGRRATVCDGSSHSSALRTFTAAPLYADTPLQSARIVHFFLAHGQSGMQRLLDRNDHDWMRSQAFLNEIYSMTPKVARTWLTEQWRDLPIETLDGWITFLFPSETCPAYLVLDRQTMRNTHWWFWFSSWNAERGAGIHPNYILFPKMPLAGEHGGIVDPDGLFTIDMNEGVVQFQGNTVMLKRLNLISERSEDAIDFAHEGHWIMDINTTDHYGVLHDPFTHNKVGNQLYMQTMHDPLFERVYIAGAEFQLWRVHHPDDIATHAPFSE
ncbi:STT3 domain-containing protein [Thiocapsa bogorovii]|uniref:STT3 domain-containing protein n=1 Tax=Thiocapsa bogorovii TaxID=521689 RepID=UPI001E617510|nr:STT3 domain-containing protein [Thiocapsa bogorovii]UHD16876.1 hypothetical protein LT988_02075 [Thiocapsa bogorovii]